MICLHYQFKHTNPTVGHFPDLQFASMCGIWVVHLELIVLGLQLLFQGLYSFLSILPPLLLVIELLTERRKLNRDKMQDMILLGQENVTLMHHKNCFPKHILEIFISIIIIGTVQNPRTIQ